MDLDPGVSGGPSRIAIIGGGYAGMAAAAELAARKIPATLFEASRTLGGRARGVDSHGVRVDNGQHILIGAYSETLRLLRLVGADTERLFLRLPLTLCFPGQIFIKAAPLPAPLHLAAALLGASGLTLCEKFAAIRFMRSLKKRGYRLPSDTTVTLFLDAQDQPARLREFLWEPLCLAALNTRPETASAQVFINVLRDSLAADRHASDLMLPKVDLGALFPDVAKMYVAKNGGRVLRGTAIRNIAMSGSGFTLQDETTEHGVFSQVIVAVAPHHLPPLLAGLPGLDDLGKQISSLAWEPIVTCYLAYPQQTRLPQPMLGHAGGCLQWLIDRGQLGGPAGLFAAVISARGRHLEMSHEQLSAQIHSEISGIVAGLPDPLWFQVIIEKRATFACVPGARRPAAETALPGLLLAGDYVASDYPATLESAVRSGVKAARLAAKSADRLAPAADFPDVDSLSLSPE